MSSSNDVFEPEDFENLIAAVESLDGPADDESPPTLSLDTPDTDTLDPVVGNPFLKPSTASSQQAKFTPSSPADLPSTAPAQFAIDDSLDSESVSFEQTEDEFADLNEMSADLSELNFDQNSAAPRPAPAPSLELSNELHFEEPWIADELITNEPVTKEPIVQQTDSTSVPLAPIPQAPVPQRDGRMGGADQARRARRDPGRRHQRGAARDRRVES